MAPVLRISRCVINRLYTIKEKCYAYIYGIITNDSVLVLGFITCRRSVNDIRDNFPGEINTCGVISIGEKDYPSAVAKNLIKHVDVTDNPIFLMYPLDSNSKLSAYYIVNGKAEAIPFILYSEANIWNDYITVRLQAKIPFCSDFQKYAIQESFNALRKQIASGCITFHFPTTNIYLMGHNETGSSAINSNLNVGKLLDISLNVSEGCINTKIKKKSNIVELDILDVVMMRSSLRNSILNRKSRCPIIAVNRRVYECLCLPLKIDSVSMVSRKTKITSLYNTIIESVCRNLKLLERCILEQKKNEAINREIGRPLISQPEPFHFMPSNFEHFITKYFPKYTTEDDLGSEREKMHEFFMLPKKWPSFKRTNAFVFKDELSPTGPLVNPHDSILTSICSETEICLVRGKYKYYHYMQQGIDDNGWGCAYRSLQTLFSWFQLQGYTEKSVPTHLDIQKCLVFIEDKPPSFIGSHQWIGSTEVSFCLDAMLGVQCRILHATTGNELAAMGPEIITHFKVQGTPIMIGGGQLAHTIIGVDYNKITGHLRYLVLDPHYTGDEDIHVIIGKGWCGWKNPTFWKKHSYYNLCLPQIPFCF